jgi:uncharacterized protein GlcG (DUF336 family)
MKFETATAILGAARAHAHKAGMKPLAFAVLDARGALKAFAADDGTSLKRGEIAIGKAHGALALGVGTRGIQEMALNRAHFVASVSHAVGGSLVTTPGGVLIKDKGGQLLGAIGVSGDTSDNDEAAALAGIVAAGLSGETG